MIRHLHQATQISKLINEFKQLADVVGDRRTVGIHLFEILLEDFASTCTPTCQSWSYIKPQMALCSIKLPKQNRNQ